MVTFKFTSNRKFCQCMISLQQRRNKYFSVSKTLAHKYNYIHSQFSYSVSYLQPCPIITDPITTPPIDNYTVNIIESGNTYSTEDIDSSTCNYTIEVDEDDIYNIEVFANNIVGSSNKRKVDFGEYIVL